MATIQDILGYTTEQLEAATDEQLTTWLEPYFESCRPKTREEILSEQQIAFAEGLVTKKAKKLSKKDALLAELEDI